MCAATSFPHAAPATPGRSPAWDERQQRDTCGGCTFVNRAAAELLGWPAEQVLGRNMHALIHHTHGNGRHYPEADCPIFNAFRQGLPCRIDREVLWRADGSSFSAEYSSYPIVDDGQVRGAVVTIVDISERKRTEAALLQAREQLEQRVAKRTGELSRALGQLRELSAYSETVREQERTRIAREIHDQWTTSAASSPTCARASSTTRACGRHSNGRRRSSAPPPN